MSHPLCDLSLQLVQAEDPRKRREVICQILSEKGIPWMLQQEGDIVNILTLPTGNVQDLPAVFAHWDVAEGSSGANDNLAGVAVLIELAACCGSCFQAVFLDQEETGHGGARLFCRKRKDTPPAAAVVLDVVGCGSVEAYRIVQGHFHPLFRRFRQRFFRKKYRLQSVPGLPESDEAVLKELSVPVMLVSMLPEEDFRMLDAARQYYGPLLWMSSAGIPVMESLEVRRTIHAGDLDGPQCLLESSMENVLHHLQEVFTS